MVHLLKICLPSNPAALRILPVGFVFFCFVYTPNRRQLQVILMINHDIESLVQLLGYQDSSHPQLDDGYPFVCPKHHQFFGKLLDNIDEY